MPENFYKNKKVFITGHTGFKGSWLCRILSDLGAQVTGFSLEPPTVPSLYKVADTDSLVTSFIGDIRSYDELKKAFDSSEPEIVFHLAAQPIVLEGYKSPAYTYETNVMGTVNILECVRNSDCVRSFVNVTTDKVYRNTERNEGYSEDDVLDGFDPYSNSKSCSELVTASYKRSFFSDKNIAVSTARAGNVIGGGDFAPDRIVPDCFRAASTGKEIVIRNPHSVRPYQHVLEPLFAYMMIAEKQYSDHSLAGNYNVGPNEEDCLKTGTLADIFVSYWGDGAKCVKGNVPGPKEMTTLRLNSSKISEKLGFKPKWNADEAIKKSVEWYKCYVNGGDIGTLMSRQITEYLKSTRSEMK